MSPVPSSFQLTSTLGAPLEFALSLARANAALLRRLDSTLGNVHGISFSDFQLLLYLGRAPGGRLRRVDLAEQLGLTASGVTRSLLPLEKIGLVTRQSDPRDARVGYAIITATGSELVTNATTVVDNISRAMLGAPPREQIEATSNLLAQLAGAGHHN